MRSSFAIIFICGILDLLSYICEQTLNLYSICSGLDLKFSCLGQKTLVDKTGKMSDQFLVGQVLPSLRTSMSIAAPTLLGVTLDDLDLPPPSYSEATKIPRLSYIDFPPKCTSEGGIL